MFMILKFIREGPRAVFEKVLSAFLDDCRTCFSWKKDRNLRDALPWIARFDPSKAQEAANMIYKCQIRRQAYRMLGVSREPM